MVRFPAEPDPANRSGLTDRAEPRSALMVRVSGVVQGVGFRPFVHRLAERHALAGWVRNGAGDVHIEVEGLPAELDAFVLELSGMAPPLSRIDRVSAVPAPPRGREGFSILCSEEAPEGGRRQPVPPDVALCAACETELRTPSNRRHDYPFITCTDCGPRFTVIEAMPYDRERTTMRAFLQCPACLAEYRTPGDRRHHSESNSCPVCGPVVWTELPGQAAPIVDGSGPALEWAAGMLVEGRILGLRGMGGFHLAADATSEAAVAELRRRKARPVKPFAVMVSSVDEARLLAEIDAVEARLLLSRERPVVLLRARSPSQLAPSVAPHLDTIGVMLPSTPLHVLLLEQVHRPLVMTSGNRSEEPIAAANAEARDRLGSIVDGFLLHDREIAFRCDDSVLRVSEDLPVFLRRARGFAPLPIALPVPTPVPLLAVGPHLKNTFTLAHGGQAFVSPHVGDLEGLETLEQFHRSVDHLSRLFQIVPRAVARDLHPGYLSTRIAEEMGLPRIIPVQHHHAHIAAVLAENGEVGPVLGVAFDGTGYGDDGAVWGGELLLADLLGYRRMGHLRYVPLPGGDRAARTPWRVAAGYAALEPRLAPAFQCAFEGLDPRERTATEWQIAAGVNTSRASSMGRLFDAAAAILGVRRVADYEGQAAMELEALAGKRIASEYRCGLEEGPDGLLILDPVPLLVRLGLSKLRGENAADLAADFHASIAWMTTHWVRRVAERAGVDTVALGGGTFQNARLFASLRHRLQAAGLRVLTPRVLSPNDGAVSYGQAAVAAARLARETA